MSARFSAHHFLRCSSVTACVLVLLLGTTAEAMTPAERLRAYSQEFHKELIRVTDDVYVAVGFGMANCTMVVGRDGVIIIDTLESTSAAREVLRQFRTVTDKPVKAIIYTHSHRDHIGGTSVFAGQDNPQIFAHGPFNDAPEVRELKTILKRRGRRQFGVRLEGEQVINVGIGAEVSMEGFGKGYLKPTRTFDGQRLAVEVAGVKIELHYAPGETSDQIYVWLPEQRVLHCGDNYYKSFPNLYAIRGTSYRDVVQWADSLDKMLAHRPQHLVPGHTRPVQGAEQVAEVLTDYRDAIRWVFRKTMEGMNDGLSPAKLVQQVKLPAELRDKPHLQEYYGTVEWSVRAIYEAYLGWFDGNPTNLFAMPPADEAAHIAQLAGGAEVLHAKLAAALKQRDYVWAAKLADYLLALEGESAAVLQQKAAALEALAEQQLNAPARNYYLSVARELRLASKVVERE